MAYSTQSDLEFAVGGLSKLVELSDWDNNGALDAGVIAKAIANADAEIDSYLRVRFATPVTSPSQTLIGLSAKWAVFLMKDARGMASADDIKAHAEIHIKTAEDLRDGKIRPDEPNPKASTAVRTSWRERDPSGEGMSRTGLKGAW